jgi:Mor family transcriptional regulator
MKSAMDKLRSELLDDVSAHVIEVLKDHGITESIAEQCGIALADHLAENWGGQLINFPKNFFYKLAQRDLEIYGRFNGRNYSQLAKEEGMTVRGIYKLIARVQKRVIAETQPDLF